MEGARGHVALCVSGSVAAHRALDLTSELLKHGVRVTVLMTAGAKAFITPLFFQALSRERVHHEVFAGGAGEDPYDHLKPAREADLMIHAPATADLIARLAHGIADDPVTTCALAYAGPAVLCPAMNWRMWQHPRVQANVRTLVDDGMTVIGPDEGDLACGEQGPGRMTPVARILEHALRTLDARSA